LSPPLDGEFGLDLLEEALGQGTAEVFHTDQGAPFTAAAWTGRLEAAGVKEDPEDRVPLDGKGRCLDNVFVECLWRSLTWEDVYPHRYEDVPARRAGLIHSFAFANEERRQQALDEQTPAAVYRPGRPAAWAAGAGEGRAKRSAAP